MNATDLLERAVGCHSIGRLRDADALYEEFLESHPEHAEALHFRGVALYQLGNSTSAESLIRKAIAVNPGDADYHSNLGLVLKNLERYEEAIESFEAALVLRPEYPDCLNNMATALIAVDRSSDAEAVLQSLVTRHPGYAGGHNNLGTLLLKKSKVREAHESFLRALALKPDYRDALVNLARVQLRRNLFADAVSTFRRVVGDDEEDAGLIRDFVVALIANDEFQEAERLCHLAIKADSGSADSIVSLGHLQQAMEQLDEAEKTYLAALDKDARNVRATNNLGTIHVRRGDTRQALDWFLKAVRLDNNFVESFFNAGVAYRQIGDLESAIEYLNAAISRRADLPRAYRYLSEIYRVRNEGEKQKETLMAWLEIDPESATAIHLLAASQNKSDVNRASDEFIREEFDDFADSFNETLEKLHYSTPEKILDLLGRQEVDTTRIARALDAGCGTGLCGDGMTKLAQSVTGVDLSVNMLRQASKLDIYDELVEGELVSYMQSRPSTFDLVVSADTLVYFGALEEAVDAVRSTLTDGGLFAFSLELSGKADLASYELQSSGRYCHAESYVEQCLSDRGFEICEKEETEIRQESSRPVIGLLYVAMLVGENRE